jgi:hypothetical protein
MKTSCETEADTSSKSNPATNVLNHISSSVRLFLFSGGHKEINSAQSP